MGLIAALGLALSACTPPGRPSPPRPISTPTSASTPAHWSAYRAREPGLVWSLSYPSTWHIQPYRAGCGDWLGPGVIVENGGFRFRHQVVADGCTNGWAFAGAPARLVAVDVQPAVLGPAFPRGHPDTRFPLSLHVVAGRPRPAPSPGAHVSEYVLRIWARGYPVYDVLVWIGRGAAAADVALAERIVATVRVR